MGAAQEKEERKRQVGAAAQAARAEQARQARRVAGAGYEDAEWIKASEQEQLEQLQAEQQDSEQKAAAQVCCRAALQQRLPRWLLHVSGVTG